MRTPRRRPDRSASNVQSVQVFCRIKPNDTSAPSCVEAVNGTTLKIIGSRAGLLKETLHTFTAVHGENDSQHAIFQNVAFPLVSELLDGKNGLLLTYGTTGSGKTYVMQGSSKEAGILSLSLDVIFNSVGNRQTKKYVVKPDGLNGFDIQSESDAIMERHRLDYQQRLKLPRGNNLIEGNNKDRTSLTVDVPSKALYAVFISLVEIYNNSVFDLLTESTDAPGKTMASRALREDAQRNVYVSGCAEIEVKSTEDALKIFSIGQKRRRIGLTALNPESSRSHCVFMIRLVRTGFDERYNEAIEDKSLLTVSQLCLVDLAGSERASRAGTHGDRLKEASSINNCLMNLRKCLQVLREIQSTQGPMGLATPGGTSRVVPYRDRRLTHLFKNYFEGNGRVVILVCIRQSVEDYDETMNVLKFAETSQEVSTFRTPTRPPPRSPVSQLRPYCMVPIRDIDHSIESRDTTMSSTTSEQTNSVLLELGNCNTEIDRYLSRLLDEVASQEFKLDRHFCELGNDENYLSDESTQDSAPEQDRYTESLCGKGLGLRKADTEPLRALFTQRLETRKRAFCALECEMAAFRSQLTDFANTDSPQTNSVLSTYELSDRSKLEAHIHWLEGQIIENTKSANRELDSQMRQMEEYRSEIESLRAELANLKRSRLSEDHDGQREGRLRPSVSRSNIVSILSRQWERRLAEQQSAIQAEKVGTRRRRVAVTATNSPGKRVAAFNPRHRRSRSTGGDGARWLEHQETTSVPLGTVFTPTLKSRKSVTQVELKDTLKSSNYLLHHQEATPDGNVKTKLYKGSIIPTAGGGSAVILNDVEELRQTSPVTPKRTSRRDSTPLLKCSHPDVEDQPNRKRPKRTDSSSNHLQAARSSTSEDVSEESIRTTRSSNYQPIVPLLTPPMMPSHMGSEVLRERCFVGISSSGGMGTSRIVYS